MTTNEFLKEIELGALEDCEMNPSEAEAYQAWAEAEAERQEELAAEVE